MNNVAMARAYVFLAVERIRHSEEAMEQAVSVFIIIHSARIY